MQTVNKQDTATQGVVNAPFITQDDVLTLQYMDGNGIAKISVKAPELVRAISHVKRKAGRRMKTGAIIQSLPTVFNEFAKTVGWLKRVFAIVDEDCFTLVFIIKDTSEHNNVWMCHSIAMALIEVFGVNIDASVIEDDLEPKPGYTVIL